MRIGVMTSVFKRPTIEDVAKAIRAAGLTAIQLSLESAGLEDLPATLDEPTCARIRAAFDRQGVAISAVSGTFNAIDPDSARRVESIRRVALLASRCHALGTSVITQCTGTRHPSNMWRHHPANAQPDAWADCVTTMRALTREAESAGVTLAFEPETVNVVDTAAKAVRLIEEVGSSRLRIVMDPANYFHPAMLPRMDEVLEEVFELVGGYIALAHAKDVRLSASGDGECVRPAAGQGVLNYAAYNRLLNASGYNGGLVMHSLSEAEVPSSRDYVRGFFGQI